GRAMAEPSVALLDHRPPAAADLAAEEPAPASTRLTMQLYLAPRHAAELDRLVRDQQDPASPTYHRWLDAAEYEARFAPTPRDVAVLSRWLVHHGFRVTLASAAEARIAFEGSVATAAAALRVPIAGSRDGRWYANVGDPKMPSSLAAKVRHIDGLHNLSATT